MTKKKASAPEPEDDIVFEYEVDDRVNTEHFGISKILRRRAFEGEPLYYAMTETKGLQYLRDGDIVGKA